MVYCEHSCIHFNSILINSDSCILGMQKQFQTFQDLSKGWTIESKHLTNIFWQPKYFLLRASVATVMGSYLLTKAILFTKWPNIDNLCRSYSCHYTSHRGSTIGWSLIMGYCILTCPSTVTEVMIGLILTHILLSKFDSYKFGLSNFCKSQGWSSYSTSLSNSSQC